MSTNLELKLKETSDLLEQEKGKRIAVERDNYEIKRHAAQVQTQAAALKAETEASLLEAAKQMEIAMAVSQGIYGMARMGRAYIARKVAAARVVHREQQMTLLMQQVIDGLEKNNQEQVKTGIEKMKAVIQVIHRDGESSRLQAAESALAFGQERFEEIFDQLVSERNQLV